MSSCISWFGRETGRIGWVPAIGVGGGLWNEVEIDSGFQLVGGGGENLDSVHLPFKAFRSSGLRTQSRRSRPPLRTTTRSIFLQGTSIHWYVLSVRVTDRRSRSCRGHRLQ